MSYGHMAGDAVLKKIAQWLKASFDLPGQLVFRYGGEEFGVILPGVQKKEAVRLADGFRRSLSDRDVSLRREKIAVRVSLGVASFPDDAAEEKELIQAADDALLKAKRSGRDKVCSFYDPDFSGFGCCDLAVFCRGFWLTRRLKRSPISHPWRLLFSRY
jgi:diguanylate cyclase